MLRRIVLTKGHEPLKNAWNARSFAASSAASLLDTKVKVQGMVFDEGYHPVRVTGESALAMEQPLALGFNYRSLALHAVNEPGAAYATRGMFDDEDAIERMKSDRGEEVIGVYADPPIQPFSVYCGKSAVGADTNVATKLGINQLRKAGLTGKNVRVAIVDTGIDGSIIPVAGGWSPIPGSTPGTTPSDHGTMCAYDVRISAPDAKILDYALLQSTGPGWAGFLSDALNAFANLMQLLQNEPGPLVVNNSWGMFDRSEDEPIGSDGNYSANPNHPFNQIVGSLVAAGADVCFAAGNCGGNCPDIRCGAHDKGAGQSIHGANSHPDVITVAAVTIDNRRLGYSAQGPGGLAKRKPDVAGYSHFRGSGVEEVDSGTSAAAPVVAGVIAALRQKASISKFPPASMKGLLQRTCTDVNGSGWDFDFGYGVVNAGAAAKALNISAPTKKTSSAKKAAGSAKKKATGKGA
jgi:subtilisin family serine protease